MPEDPGDGSSKLFQKLSLLPQARVIGALVGHSMLLTLLVTYALIEVFPHASLTRHINANLSAPVNTNTPPADPANVPNPSAGNGTNGTGTGTGNASPATAGKPTGSPTPGVGTDGSATSPSNAKPASQGQAPGAPAAAFTERSRVTLFQVLTIAITWEARLLLMVALAGVLGSLIHAMTSLTDYIGNRSLVLSWIPWYLLRPLNGMALALLCYIAVRAAGPATPEYNPFSFALLAGLAGLFSKQATDKLEELFSLLLRPSPGKGDQARKDSLVQKPVLSALDPKELTAGAASATVRLLGSGFSAALGVTVNGQARPYVMMSPTELRVDLRTEDLAQPGDLTVVLVHQPTGAQIGSLRVPVQ